MIYIKILKIKISVKEHFSNIIWKAINKNDLLDDLCNYSLKILSKYFEEKKDNLTDKHVSLI